MDSTKLVAIEIALSLSISREDAAKQNLESPANVTSSAANSLGVLQSAALWFSSFCYRSFPEKVTHLRTVISTISQKLLHIYAITVTYKCVLAESLEIAFVCLKSLLRWRTTEGSDQLQNCRLDYNRDLAES
ncbi:hypothetical protein PUN28_012094 [Cardiocondyla obscurior]|uniref:Uncharacterized protein n=1 Tax=Cardiocondyla obscurior TaxID=286306 RepID=A0AAW2FCA3_9HYME